MNAGRLFPAIAAISLSAALACAEVVTYDMVRVGDPGNANDASGYGGVPYEYEIGKCEVTIGQYASFLNAVAKTDPYSLYNTGMATDQRIAGISRSGASGAYVYAVTGPSGNVQIPQSTSTNRPVAYVGWFDAARFANWMANGQPSGVQDATTTENGAYALNGATSGTAPPLNAINPNTGAASLYRIPTENEWYKAAYYKGGGVNAGYWTYATQSDASPGNVPGSAANNANFNNGVFAVTQVSGTASGDQNYLTDGGAFSASPSFYGTFDQCGNVNEFITLSGSNAGRGYGARGGSWADSDISSSYRFGPNASPLLHNLGFRLAAPVAVPEPSTCVTLSAGLLFGCWHVLCGKRKSPSRALALLVCGLMSSTAQAVTYEMVFVGNAGNAADTTGYGAVPYEYQIGKYEVTLGQYVEFLNSVLKTDPGTQFNLYVPPGGNVWTHGIARLGSPGSFSYSAYIPTLPSWWGIGGGVYRTGADSPTERPVNLDWFQAARFANWMSNGQPTGAPGPKTTEDGTYQLYGAVGNVWDVTKPHRPTRNMVNPNTGSAPLYSIPTENEWYKAAYYKGGGVNATYWTYATQSDSPPGITIGSDANQASYAPWWFSSSGYFQTNGSAAWPGVTYVQHIPGSALTNVGAFSGSPSAYGTFDQCGNLSEWNDLTGYDADGRPAGAGVYSVIRGGDFFSNSSSLASTVRGGLEYTGARLASPVAVPPMTIGVASGTQTQAAVGYPSLFGQTPILKTGSGTLVLNQANMLTGSMAVQAGSLRLAHPSALVSSRLVPLVGGIVTVAPGLQTTVRGLAPRAGGSVDVSDGAITVAAGLTQSDLIAALVSGRGDGSWNGTTGITSSVAATSFGTRAVGWLDNGDGSMTFGYAAPGDTNLDWVLDLIDVANLVSSGKYGVVDPANPATWVEGDFNYDGIVDLTDLVDFSATGLYGGSSYNSSSGVVAAVPEPSTSAIVLAGLAGGLAMWRGRRC